MEYIKEINIVEAVIHILDNNADEPILNEFALELNEETYTFLLKHIQRCLKDDELKCGTFNQGENIVRDITREYLNGENNILTTSKELAKQMWVLMKSKGNIPSGAFITVTFSSEYGMFLGIFKMDYVKNFSHHIEYDKDKLGIDIRAQYSSLPTTSSKIKKCAFIRAKSDKYDLMFLDKIAKRKEDYGDNYFTLNFLNCSIYDDDREQTKQFLSSIEHWTRRALHENAAAQLKVRKTILEEIKNKDVIEIRELSEKLFSNNNIAKLDFENFLEEQGVGEKVEIDDSYIDEKLKRIKIKIDRDIEVRITEEIYKDISQFEIQDNGNGSVNIIIKNVIGYMQN